MPQTAAHTAPARCAITLEPGLLGGYRVAPEWDGVDRPNVHAWHVLTRADAERLQACVLAGKAYSSAEVRTDVAGATYVATRSEVFGKYLHEDLTRLGF